MKIEVNSETLTDGVRSARVYRITATDGEREVGKLPLMNKLEMMRLLKQIASALNFRAERDGDALYLDITETMPRDDRPRDGRGRPIEGE